MRNDDLERATAALRQLHQAMSELVRDVEPRLDRLQSNAPTLLARLDEVRYVLHRIDAEEPVVGHLWRQAERIAADYDEVPDRRDEDGRDGWSPR